jgi:ketosteroid isomerase-like protein
MMRYRTALCVLVAFAFLCLRPNVIAAQQGNGGSDEEALQLLLKNYANSVDTLDLQLAGQVWSHAPEVVFIHPRGTEVGFAQIMENFYSKTMGTFSERELILESPVLHVYGDTAWSQMTWTFHATVKNGGPKITTQGRETQVYHKEDGKWHIVHVHYSGLPVTGALKGF